MINRKTMLVVLPAIALSACATGAGDKYPSLAIRDIERVQGTFEPVPSAPLDVPGVDTGAIAGTGPLDVRLTALVEQARKAHDVFMASAPKAERAVSTAGGAAVGSDSWASAQVALADLDSARSEAAVALGDLDILYAAAAVQADDVTAIEAARNQVIAIVGEEDATLERLRGKVR